MKDEKSWHFLVISGIFFIKNKKSLAAVFAYLLFNFK